MEWEEIGRQGAAIDHKPILIRRNFKLLQEFNHMKTHNNKHKQMSTHNKQLLKYYEQYIIATNNMCKRQPDEVDTKIMEEIEQMQQWVEEEIKTRIPNNNPAALTLHEIDTILEEAYWKFFGKKEQVKEQKPFITEATALTAQRRDQEWKTMRRMGQALTQGWEDKMKTIQKAIREPNNNIDSILKKMEIDDGRITKWRNAWNQWSKWDRLRNDTRKAVRIDKIKHQEKIRDEIGTPDGEDNIWKAIDKISYRKTKQSNNQSIRKEDGTWCYTTEEELEEIAKFCEKELRQTKFETQDENEEMDNENKDNHDYLEPMTAHTGDVTEAYRKTHHSKATPGWSPPNKLCVIMEKQICKPIAKAWTRLGTERYPKEWQKQWVVWIPKPGKNKRTANQRRGITVLASAPKAYLTWIQRTMQLKLEQFWQNKSRIEYGGLKGKNTSQAIAKVLGVRRLCKRKGLSTVTFAEDAIKAFDCIDRNKSIKQWGKIIGERTELFQRLKLRHETVLPCTIKDNITLTMKAEQGVPQGDPNGPPLYSLGATGFMEEIKMVQQEAEIPQIQAQYMETFEGSTTHNFQSELSTTLYVDDLLDVRTYDGKMEVKEVKKWIRKLVSTIVDTQKEWGIIANEQKTVLLIELRGKNSKKVRTQLGKEIDEIGTNGVKFKIVLRTKYLGTIIGDNQDGLNEELSERIKKANNAMGALTPVWKQKRIPMEKKIQLYCSLVRSIMSYALEVRDLNRAQLMRLEAAQIRHLRRILNSPAHVTKQTNTTVREQPRMASMDSYLQATKLNFWRKQTTCRNEAVWAASWGELNDESTRQKTTNKNKKHSNEEQIQMRHNMTALFKANGWDTNRVDVDKNGVIEMNGKMWMALAECNKQDIHALHTHTSRVESKKESKIGPEKEKTSNATNVPRNSTTKLHLLHTGGLPTKQTPPSDNW